MYSIPEGLINDLQRARRSIYSDALKIEQLQSSNTFDTTLQRVTYHFPTALPAGSKAELSIAFGGKLTGAMAGYYRASWEHEGKENFYALTQFEVHLVRGLYHPQLIIYSTKPTAARRAFPCWDEPSLKATFAIALISRADTVNLSNMPAISEAVYIPGDKASTDLASLFSGLNTQEDAWKITRFQTTPPMSSYIVAYANGHFKYLEKSVMMPLSGKPLPLRIYGPWMQKWKAQKLLTSVLG